MEFHEPPRVRCSFNRLVMKEFLIVSMRSPPVVCVTDLEEVNEIGGGFLMGAADR